MKNKRVMWIAAITLLVSAWLLIADDFLPGGNSRDSGLSGNETDAEQAPHKKKLRFAFSYSGHMGIIQDIVNDYNRNNEDGIEIELLDIPQEQYIFHLNRMMTSGDGPDVMAIPNDWLIVYAYKNWLKELSDVMVAGFLNRFSDWAVAYANNPLFSGKWYTIPSTVMIQRFIYNNDLMRKSGLTPNEPPLTLEELRSKAKAISDEGFGSSKYGFALPVGEERVAFVQNMETANTYSGVYYYNYKTGTYDVSVNRPWLQAMLDMKREGILFPGETSLKQETARAQFAEGNIGMMYANSGDASILHYKYQINLDWGVSMPPALSKDDIGAGKLMMVPEPSIGINADTQHAKEALLFWDYLHSEEFLGQLLRKGAAIPTLKGIFGNPAYKPSLAHFEDFLPTEADAPYPQLPQIIDYYLPNPIEPVYVGDRPRLKAYTSIFEEAKTIQEVIDEENRRLNEIIKFAVRERKLNLNNYRDPAFNPLEPPYELQAAP